jgi:biopolymer transport protein ExbD
MAMNVAVQGDASEEADLNTTINTTPLVDIMLVLLIIFLITVPVIVKVVPVKLPNAKNIPTQTKPQNIVISVDSDDNVYWDNAPVSSNDELLQKMESAMLAANNAGQKLPEVHIRGDKEARFEAIGRVVYDAQRAGVPKIAFITEPRKKTE